MPTERQRVRDIGNELEAHVLPEDIFTAPISVTVHEQDVQGNTAKAIPVALGDGFKWSRVALFPDGEYYEEALALRSSEDDIIEIFDGEKIDEQVWHGLLGGRRYVRVVFTGGALGTCLYAVYKNLIDECVNRGVDLELYFPLDYIYPDYEHMPARLAATIGYYKKFLDEKRLNYSLFIDGKRAPDTPAGDFSPITLRFCSDIRSLGHRLQDSDSNRLANEVEARYLYHTLDLIAIHPDTLRSHEAGYEKRAVILRDELLRDNDYSWPKIAYPAGDILVIADGEHRRRAARMLGLYLEPALVFPDPDKDLALKGWVRNEGQAEVATDPDGNVMAIDDVTRMALSGDVYPPKVTRFIPRGRVINLPCRLYSLACKTAGQEIVHPDKIRRRWLRDKKYIRLCLAGRNLIIDRDTPYEEPVWFCDTAGDIPPEVENDPNSVIDFKTMRENAAEIRKALAGDPEALTWFQEHRGMFNDLGPAERSP